MNLPAIRAAAFLEDLGITSLPVVPRDICQQLGIYYLEQPYSGFEGTLILDGGKALIGVSSLIATDTRRKFTCAHELGHYCQDVAPGTSDGRFECSATDISETNKKQQNTMENAANEFAAEVLMPKNLIRSLVDIDAVDWDGARSLATNCDVSLTAATIRYMELSNCPCALVISRAGKIEWYKPSPGFNFYVDTDSRLLPQNTHAFSANKGLSVPSDFEYVPAESWLSGRFTGESEILECTLGKNSFGEVMTLLWDDGGVTFAKDQPSRGRSTEYDEDEEGGLGVDTVMKTMNPWKKRK